MSSLYAEPRNIVNLEDCFFYHTMDLPGYGTVAGAWDLRAREAAYLGNLDFQGKKVLEVGTASGHLCFHMEKRGADVTAFDLSREQEWDIVPYAKVNYKQQILDCKQGIDRINNSFWLAYRVYNSKAKMVYGSVYQMPDDIGEFEIGTFGCIFLHLRDPFLALQKAASHIKDTIVITEPPISFADDEKGTFSKSYPGRLIRFLPDASKCQPDLTWWLLSPDLIMEFIKILGFEHTRLSYHIQLYQGNEVKLYTVVGQRPV